MMGPKKLNTIREELRRALAGTGDDPIRWLEERMATVKRQGAGAEGESEVLLSLRRVLEGPNREYRLKRRTPSKK